jgi:hypothetical protein
MVSEGRGGKGGVGGGGGKGGVGAAQQGRGAGLVVGARGVFVSLSS